MARFGILNSLLAAVLLMALLPSCNLLKPATDPNKDKVYKDDEVGDIQGGKVYDPNTGTWRSVNEVEGKVDTVRWTDLSEDKYPPIKTDSPVSGGGGGTKPNSGGNTGGNSGGNNSGGATTGTGKGNVTILLPFMANAATSGVPESSQWAVSFYAGARLAYDDLEEEGVKFTVNVVDSEESSTAKVSSVLKGNELANSDLIIGPYKRDNVNLLADFAKKNKVPLVVPYTAQTGVTEDNPYYIQVNPSLKAHCEAMTNHIRQSHQPENVVLVALDKPEEKARFKFFQDANAVIEKGKTNRKFKELLVPEGASNFHSINIGQFLNSSGTTVFVVPSWSNQTFIYSLLRQLMAKQGEGDDIIVYGMNMWLDFEQLDFEYFEKLKLHVSSASYMDPNDERVKQFKQKYFQSYGTVPNDEAYLGYDVMLYFGKQLAKYGKDFPKQLDGRPSDVLHGRFNFQRSVADPSKHKEDLDYYDQLENQFVHILKFQEFHLQPAD